MPSTINADTGAITGTTGIVQTADGSGELALQANGNTVVTMSTNRLANFTGNVSVTNIIANNGLIINNANVSSYVIASGFNAMSTGPVTVPAGQVVNVSSNARWVVL